VCPMIEQNVPLRIIPAKDTEHKPRRPAGSRFIWEVADSAHLSDYRGCAGMNQYMRGRPGLRRGDLRATLTATRNALITHGIFDRPGSGNGVGGIWRG